MSGCETALVVLIAIAIGFICGRILMWFLEKK